MMFSYISLLSYTDSLNLCVSGKILEYLFNKTFFFTSIPIPTADWVSWEANSESEISMQNVRKKAGWAEAEAEL